MGGKLAKTNTCVGFNLLVLHQQDSSHKEHESQLLSQDSEGTWSPIATGRTGTSNLIRPSSRLIGVMPQLQCSTPPTKASWSSVRPVNYQIFLVTLISLFTWRGAISSDVTSLFGGDGGVVRNLYNLRHLRPDSQFSSIYNTSKRATTVPYWGQNWSNETQGLRFFLHWITGERVVASLAKNMAPVILSPRPPPRLCFPVSWSRCRIS